MSDTSHRGDLGGPAQAIAPATRRGSGSVLMVLGTVVSAIAAYLFQVIGGRALGAEAFAPVSVVWTILFLGLTIFLIPVEHLVIRRLTLGQGRVSALSGSWPAIGAVIGGATLLALGFTAAVREPLLNGQVAYLAVAAAMFPGHGLFVLGRGFLAGRGRFSAYGVAVGLDALTKLTGAIVVAVAGLGPIALSWALVVSPVVILTVRPFRAPTHSPTSTDRSVTGGSDSRFLAGFVVATAASQTVLAAGPLVVGALGASSASISIFFVTTTLFRGPMSASYNLIARILPTMTRRAAAGDRSELNQWARRLAIGGCALAALGGALAAAVGPAVVAFLYGSDFRPSSSLAGLAGAAVIAAMVGLGTSQILVGRGETGRMAIVWLLAVAVAAVTVAMVPSDQTIRVAAGLLIGQVVALLGLTAATLLPPTRPAPQPKST